MATELQPSSIHPSPRSVSQPNKLSIARFLLGLVLLAFASTFVVMIPPGHQGILLTLGKMQKPLLGEGLHLILPVVNTVEILNTRVQKREIEAEASSKDLQDVFTDVALNWHLIPGAVDQVFAQVGNQEQVVDHIIDPAIEEVLKAVLAKYTAEKIITKRDQVKREVDTVLINRLENYHIAIDDLSLVHIHFSKGFREAVEAKQIAEQEAKQAEFIAQKAVKQAEAMVNLAKGEAEAQRLIKATLTPEILQKRAIEKWNGNLSLMVGDKNHKFLDLKQIIPAKP
ncbi:prohibitin family protein [Synechocystis sp. FACHB-383]|uniref:prohibitin family protein n=1 Tax=Synechocystis sp. FACHB-383 TaxID=2692864 RepID=UPI001689F932|nr:prohibitin family protein [Synechocystis sp. FACHB-383]MBD2654245.1 prohibitin family protein [Synechocystis sp. FACHB-383]